jgi:hypothetical protein
MTIDINYIAATADPAQMPLAFDNKVNEGGYLLLQKVVTLLFKDTETALLPGLGTTVLEDIGGNVQEINQLQNRFNIAADRVREVIQQSATPDTPENEQLSSLEINVESSAERDKIILQIDVETVSGDAVETAVPYSLNGD